MQTKIQIGPITVEVTLKDIKNIHLSVHPPTGNVRISAPDRMELERIRVYAVSRLGWIKRQRALFASQQREEARRFCERESHYLLGERYLLKITRSPGPQTVIRRHREIEIVARPDTDADGLRALFESFSRRLLRKEIQSLVESWSTRIGLDRPEVAIRKMKTKWGSCNPSSGRVWFNIELAKKPLECIEYVVVHELIHLLERKHNRRFIAKLESHLPNWRQVKNRLNALPIAPYE